jgi:hypothetical protein
LPIADDPCGNYILLCFDTEPPNVKLWMHEGSELLEVADSFSDFIDLLYLESEDKA